MGIGRRRGWGLLVAGLVLGAGTVVRMVQDEPAGALAAMAIVFMTLGLKAERSEDSNR